MTERAASGPAADLSAAVNVIAGVVFISMLGLTDAALATTTSET
jgi:hypothetical protein